jgi:hypothetical protein
MKQPFLSSQPHLLQPSQPHLLQPSQPHLLQPPQPHLLQPPSPNHLPGNQLPNPFPSPNQLPNPMPSPHLLHLLQPPQPALAAAAVIDTTNKTASKMPIVFMFLICIHSKLLSILIQFQAYEFFNQLSVEDAFTLPINPHIFCLKECSKSIL